MYRSIHENKRAQRRANRNIIFLLLFASAMIWSGVWLSESREERQVAGGGFALSGSMADVVTDRLTKRLCVEVNADDYLVVCPE